MLISVIGLGEAGGHYAVGLAQGGATVKGYDRSLKDPKKADHFAMCKAAGVKLCEHVEDAVQDADIVLAVTVSAAALETAAVARRSLQPNQVYVEMNSAVPKIKEEIEAMLSGTAQVVDGVTMASVKQLKHRTPVYLSGPEAQTVSDALNRYGMHTEVMGQRVGQASALKAVRSVFMKGFEAVLVECMQAADAYGMVDAVMDSILDFFQTKPLRELMEMLITTDAIHCGRRAAEVEDIIAMLRERQILPTMSVATVEKLRWVEQLQLNEVFGGRAPDDVHKVLVHLRKESDKEIV